MFEQTIDYTKDESEEATKNVQSLFDEFVSMN